MNEKIMLCKRVSGLETCIDYFALPGRTCENLNLCFPAQMFFGGLLIFLMSFMAKWARKFKFSQLLPGSAKQSIHVSKSETPLLQFHLNAYNVINVSIQPV